MLVTRVIAQNFGCHEEFDEEFSAGICGILGKNGSGKSTILDMIRFGITGELAAEGSKADNVMWGAEMATVTVEFIHGDSCYSITRTLGKRNSQKLVTPDETITRRGEISEFIESLCSTTTSAMLNNVFVPQGKIDSILFSTNTQRLKEIQETVGLQRAAEAEKALRNEIGRYNVTIGLDHQIEMAVQSIEEVEKELAQLNEELTKVETEISELQPYADLLDQFRRQSQNNVAIQQSDKRIEKLAVELEEAVNRLEQLTERRNGLRKMAATTKSSAEHARSMLAQHEADKRALRSRQDMQQQLAEVEQSLAELGTRPEGNLEELQERVEKITDRIRTREQQLKGTVALPEELVNDEELSTKRASLREEIDKRSHEHTLQVSKISDEVQRLRRELALFEKGECPTCHQDVPTQFVQETEQKIAEREKELSERKASYEAWHTQAQQELEEIDQTLQKKRDEARKAVQASKENLISKLAEARSLRDSLVGFTSSHESLTNRKELLEKQLESTTAEPLSEDEVEKLQQSVSSYERVAISVVEQETSVKAEVAVVDRLEQQIEAAREERKELGESVEMPSDEEVAKAKEQTEILSARTQLRIKLDREITSAEVQLEQYRTSLKSLKETYENEAIDAAWVKVCKRAREVLHVSGLPSLLMREYAAVLNQRIAHYLSVWEAEFSLELDENFSFLASVEDGPWVSASRLSGGQKVIASTSFRLAMADTFARQVGLLILDEPSNHLDKDNVIHLQHLMLRLKELAGSTGRQVIMVDHEESLVGFFDHVITLEPISEEE